MFDFVLTIMIFFIVLFVAMIPLASVAAFIYAIVKLARKGVAAKPPAFAATANGECPGVKCRAPNPPGAAFCRRCGARLSRPQSTVVQGIRWTASGGYQ